MPDFELVRDKLNRDKRVDCIYEARPTVVQIYKRFKDEVDDIKRIVHPLQIRVEVMPYDKPGVFTYM